MKHSKVLIKYILIFQLLTTVCFSPLFAQQNDTLALSSQNVPGDKMLDLAYGKQTAKSLSESIGTVYSDQLLKSSVTNVGNALFGRIPGLIVRQGSGEPSNDLPTLLIRGLASFVNSGVLIFVDGFEYSYDGLSLEEVENVTILKDAAALAPYGMRGANGVILITTKRGEVGKTKLIGNLQYGIQQPTQLPDLLDSYNYSRLYNEALANDGKLQAFTAADLQAFKDGTDPYFHPTVNWFDEVLKKQSSVLTGNLNVSGGSENVRYYVLMDLLKNTGLYNNTTGVFPNINTNELQNRFIFRSNFDVTLTKNLSLALNLSGRLNQLHSPFNSSSTIWTHMYNTAPNLYPVLNPNGSLGGTQIERDNVYALVSKTGYSNVSDRRFQGIFRLNHKLDFITEGLSASAAISLNNWYAGSENYSLQNAVYELSKGPSGETVYNMYGQDGTLSYSTPSNHNNRSGLEGRLEYIKDFGEHQINSMVLYQQDRFIIPGNNFAIQHQGVAGRLQYGYKERYFGEFTFGVNGSENFQLGKRFGFFPAISAAWLISEEDFLKDNKVLNFLKVRGSYGIVGNDNFGVTNYSGNSRFMYLDSYVGATGYYFGSGNSSSGGTGEGTVANPDITWEKSYKTDFGVEARLLNSFYLMIDLFHEKRTDLFSPRSLEYPGIYGRSWTLENYGEITNRGFESSLQFNKLINDVGISAGINLAYNHSLIKSRKEFYPITVGSSVSQYIGLEAIGFFSSTADIANSPEQSFGQVQVGDIKYKDQNSDEVIDFLDMVPVGKNSIPELDYGINLGITYKGVGIEAFLQGQDNLSIYVSNILTGPMGGANAQYSEFAMNSFSENNMSATYPRLTTEKNPNNYQTNSIWVMDGSFLKLRSIELSYQLPGHLLEHMLMSSAKVYLRGMNLFSIDKFNGLDPETITGYPAMKTIYGGVRFEF